MFVASVAVVVSFVLLVPWSANCVALFFRFEAVSAQWGAAVIEELFAFASRMIMLVFRE